MSVLQVVTRMNIGGPARLLLDLARGLGEEFDLELAAGAAPAHEGELVDPAVDVLRLPLVRELRPLIDLRALIQLRDIISRRRFAVVHTHMAKAGAVGRIAALSVTPRPQTVHTFHGHVLSGYFSPAKQRFFLEIERALAPRTTVLVAVSERLRDELLALGVGSPSQYRVIPVGIDLQAFSRDDADRGWLRQHLGLSRAVPLLGMVGRLTAIKDNPTALDALLHLPGVHLAFIGDGELRLELERRVVTMGLAERVHFLGWSSDIPSALRDLDAVVLTSLNEGVPVALVEALAAGTPIVATRVGGVPDLISDGITGFLVDPGRPDQVAAAVRRVIDDPGVRREFASLGRKLVVDRYSLDACLRSHAALYRELEATPS